MQKRPLAARCKNPGQKNPKVPARKLFILFRNFRDLRFPGRKEYSVRVPKRAAGHLGRSSSQTSDRVSTTKTCRPK